METIFACFKTLFFALIPVSPCECLVIKELQKQRISFDSHKYPPPFFCLYAVWWHAIRLFSCLVLKLNCKDLSLFRQNGEFEKSAFRRAEIRQNPPNSPFCDFRGHGNLPSCKCFIDRISYWKSLFFSCFSNECNGEFCFTNCRPLSIFLDNQRVTRKSEIFVFITNAHQSIDIAVSPIAILDFCRSW